MTTINSISINNNKDFDDEDDEHEDIWLPSRIADAIFNDLMENGDEHDKENNDNRYISQIVEKFDYIRLKYTGTLYEIYYNNLSEETRFQIEGYLKGCTTPYEKYKKLNGIMPDVIARIAKQAEHKILANKMTEDPLFIKVNTNSMRELVSNKWKFIE